MPDFNQNRKEERGGKTMNKLLSKREVEETLSVSGRKFLAF